MRPAPFAFEHASWHGGDEFSMRRWQVGEICKFSGGLRESKLEADTSCPPRGRDTCGYGCVGCSDSDPRPSFLRMIQAEILLLCLDGFDLVRRARHDICCWWRKYRSLGGPPCAFVFIGRTPVLLHERTQGLVRGPLPAGPIHFR